MCTTFPLSEKKKKSNKCYSGKCFSTYLDRFVIIWIASSCWNQKGHRHGNNSRQGEQNDDRASQDNPVFFLDSLISGSCENSEKKKLRDILQLVLCLIRIKKETLLHAEPSHFCVCATSYVINTINCKLSPPITKTKQNKTQISHQRVSSSFSSLMESWVVVTSRFFIDLVEYSQVTSQWAWQLNQRQCGYTMIITPWSRRWLSTHFWIACSRSYSRAVYFVSWPLPRPLTLRGQPDSRNTGKSQERHALKTGQAGPALK